MLNWRKASITFLQINLHWFVSYEHVSTNTLVNEINPFIKKNEKCNITCITCLLGRSHQNTCSSVTGEPGSALLLSAFCIGPKISFGPKWPEICLIIQQFFFYQKFIINWNRWRFALKKMKENANICGYLSYKPRQLFMR